MGRVWVSSATGRFAALPDRSLPGTPWCSRLSRRPCTAQRTNCIKPSYRSARRPGGIGWRILQAGWSARSAVDASWNAGRRTASRDNFFLCQYNAALMATIDPATTKRPLVPPDRALVAETIQTRLPSHGTVKKLLPLAGDASNRRYFRIEMSGEALCSVVLMQLAEPEAFKQSEEAVSGAPHAIAELPFINIQTHLSKAEVSVPALYYYDQAAGLLSLEDCVDLPLSEACAKGGTADLEAR